MSTTGPALDDGHGSPLILAEAAAATTSVHIFSLLCAFSLGSPQSARRQCCCFRGAAQTLYFFGVAEIISDNRKISNLQTLSHVLFVSKYTAPP